jgi:serine/threonine protein kinase
MVWQTGQKLQGGKYEIIKVLARGGFGITYHARHIKLNTEVVIKTPDLLQKKEIEYEQYVRQFQAEGKRLAKFSKRHLFSAKAHPNIVKARDYFLEDTLPCLVMDFIRGQTLMEIIKMQGPLSEAQCLIYIRQIGKALETIHKAKMVHRDAHPGNIMIQDGQAILIDFGIAKNIIPATHSITDLAANPDFAPYEQVYRGGKERQYTIDVYTLAATFYYAVTGKRPTPSMQRKLDDKSILIPPKQINRQLSEHINKAILKGMALEKEDRPQSMSAWLQLLETPRLFPSNVIKPKLPSKRDTIPFFSQRSPKSRKIPWISLIILFLIYGIYGISLVKTQCSLWVGVLAIAMPLTLSWVVEWSMALVVESLVAVAWSVTWAMATPSATILVMVWAMAVPISWAWSIMRLKQKNFSTFHQFLILSGVSLGGIGLGYLVGWLIRLLFAG